MIITCPHDQWEEQTQYSRGAATSNMDQSYKRDNKQSHSKKQISASHSISIFLSTSHESESSLENILFETSVENSTEQLDDNQLLNSKIKEACSLSHEFK
jgi:hypothetical protein